MENITNNGNGLMDANFGYVFPAIRGVQSRREYYVSMCPLRLIPKLFLFDEEELMPELRAQRTLNKGRIPEMARYITNNRDSYVFSALTASIDAPVEFKALGEGRDASRVGLLQVPMDARFIINDGQHRRAAIEEALQEEPNLGHETIAIVFFLDKDLNRSQQMFADLNRHAVKPSQSLGILYDHRDEMAHVARLVVAQSPIFRDIVELEKSTLAQRSRKLFTLSAIHAATKQLLCGFEFPTQEAAAKKAIEYWEETAKQFPDWQLVRDRKMSAGEIRKDFIHSHGIVLHALGHVGNSLLQNKSAGWKTKLRKLKKIDWSKNNSDLWEGRALIGGRVSKASNNVTLTSNVLKETMGIELSPEEQRVEAAHLSS